MEWENNIDWKTISIGHGRDGLFRMDTTFSSQK
jgi:hypothetical protein